MIKQDWTKAAVILTELRSRPLTLEAIELGSKMTRRGACSHTLLQVLEIGIRKYAVSRYKALMRREVINRLRRRKKRDPGEDH